MYNSTSYRGKLSSSTVSQVIFFGCRNRLKNAKMKTPLPTIPTTHTITGWLNKMLEYGVVYNSLSLSLNENNVFSKFGEMWLWTLVSLVVSPSLLSSPLGTFWTGDLEPDRLEVVSPGSCWREEREPDRLTWNMENRFLHVWIDLICSRNGKKKAMKPASPAYFRT